MAGKWINERTTTTFWAALGVGMVMTLLGGIASAMSWVAPAISLLAITGGLSIVLGAFGATATINYQGVTIAGVAALCVALFFIVIKEIRNPSVRVAVSGFPRDSSVDMYSGGTHFLGALRGDNHDVYEFAVFADEVKTRILGLNITPPKQADGVSPSDIIFGCIDSSEISDAFGSRTATQWVVDTARGQLMTLDRRSRQVSPLGGCQDAPVEMAAGKAFASWVKLSPINSAVAAEEDVSNSLRDLSAESSAIRTDARRSISELGIPAIRPLMEHWRGNDDSYRVRLGTVVALTKMMQSMKAKRKEISDELRMEDIGLLVAATDDSDRTIRIYASEFLYDLADPRVVAVVFDRMPSTIYGRYNVALILTSVAAVMSTEDRAALRQKVASIPGYSSFGERTRELLDEI